MNKAQQYKQQWAATRQAHIEQQHEELSLDAFLLHSPTDEENTSSSLWEEHYQEQQEQATRYTDEQLFAAELLAAHLEETEKQWEWHSSKQYHYFKDKIEALQLRIEIAEGKRWHLKQTIKKHQARIAELKPKLESWGRY